MLNLLIIEQKIQSARSTRVVTCWNVSCSIFLTKEKLENWGRNRRILNSAFELLTCPKCSNRILVLGSINKEKWYNFWYKVRMPMLWLEPCLSKYQSLSIPEKTARYFIGRNFHGYKLSWPPIISRVKTFTDDPFRTFRCYKILWVPNFIKLVDENFLFHARYFVVIGNQSMDDESSSKSINK